MRRSAATVAAVMSADLLTGVGRDNYELNFEGVRLSTFSREQLALAVELMARRA